MLLQVKHIGTQPSRFIGKPHSKPENWQATRCLYHIQSPTGRDGIIALSVTRTRDYGKPPRIEIALIGTEYAREYPVDGALSPRSPPRIRDLEGGYNTLAAFIACWEHSTEDQRADLGEYDQDLSHCRRGRMRKRHKWPVRHCEDHPRTIPVRETDKDTDGTWYRVDPDNLKRALKGTQSAVRIGTATIKPAILKQLCQHTGADLIELRDENGALGFRTVDPCTHDGMETITHRTKCTIKHGAGDPYAGRNGWEARIAFVPA